MPPNNHNKAGKIHTKQKGQRNSHWLTKVDPIFMPNYILVL